MYEEKSIFDDFANVRRLPFILQITRSNIKKKKIKAQTTRSKIVGASKELPLSRAISRRGSKHNLKYATAK